ncbi:MAG TPA: hypothetical protein VI685_17025 [Candidatus Angelobacter sp.]
MHFSEDDLRRALRPKDPGEAFTQRVMARINQGEAMAAAPGHVGFFSRLWPPRLRPALAGALAAGVLVAGGWFGLAQYHHSQELARGERARQQTILALRITNAKLNHVFERIKVSQTREVKVRREHL